MSENISEELEDWIISSLTKLGVAIPKLKKVKAQVYKQSHKVPHGKVFGVMLSQQLCSEQNGNDTIPKFLLEATTFLIPHLNHKCLFRKRGQDSRIRRLRERIEAGGKLDETVFIDDVATLIKAWLRELPVPVIPNEFHDFILCCHKMTVEGETNDPLLLACSLLPKPHLDTLKYLLNFLAKVAWNSVANCMDSQSLSIVFGPNLIRGDCRLVKNEKASAQVLKEKEGNERNLLQWMIEHADEISKLPDSLREIASLEAEEETLTRKKRRKSMSGFTELVGCKIKKMVTNQDKTPALNNSSRRKSLRKSQRAKGKFFVHNTDSKKGDLNTTKSKIAQLEAEKTKILEKEQEQEDVTPRSSCCSPILISSLTTSKQKDKSNVKVNINTPVTRSHSAKKIHEQVQITATRTESFKKSQEQIITENNIIDNNKCTPITRSQSHSLMKHRSSADLKPLGSMKRRSQSAINFVPITDIAESDDFDVNQMGITPTYATEVTTKLSRMSINSSIRRSGSIYRSKVSKSATLRRGRPNTIKTGLSATRKPKVRSNSSISYKNSSVRKIKIARRSRSSSNFSITEVDSITSDNSDIVLDLRLKKDEDSTSVDEEVTPKQSDEKIVKKRLDFSPSFDSKSKDVYGDGNILYCSLGFSPFLDQNIEKSIPLTIEDNSSSSEGFEEEKLKDVESNVTSALFNTPIESPIPLSQPRTRTRSKMSKIIQSSTPSNLNQFKWQDGAEFAFSNKSQEDDDVQGSKRDSIIKLREMNAGKVLASIHLYNTIEKVHNSVKASPVLKLGTFERNAIASKSVRDRKEHFKDSQGFLIPQDMPTSIKRPNPTASRLLSRTPDSPLPRNWHKKKNASADLLYVD